MTSYSGMSVSPAISPSMNWNESSALRMDDKVETVAEQNGWRLVRNEKGVYGWCVANLIKDTE